MSIIIIFDLDDAIFRFYLFIAIRNVQKYSEIHSIRRRTILHVANNKARNEARELARTDNELACFCHFLFTLNIFKRTRV